jgi:polyphosphate kinase 2 (PPK2 family)
MAAYDEMLHECSTAWAPWHVIPANQKWYRNLTIMRTIVHTLQEMNPQFPEAEGDLDQIVIE